MEKGCSYCRGPLLTYGVRLCKIDYSFPDVINYNTNNPKINIKLLRNILQFNVTL
jgi:hypothetical protein